MLKIRNLFKHWVLLPDLLFRYEKQKLEIRSPRQALSCNEVKEESIGELAWKSINLENEPNHEMLEDNSSQVLSRTQTKLEAGPISVEIS